MLRLLQVLGQLFLLVLGGGYSSAHCPTGWVTFGKSCYSSEAMSSEPEKACSALYNSSQLAVFDEDIKKRILPLNLSLSAHVRYAIGPFPPCGDQCYFLIKGNFLEETKIGSVECGTPLAFICELPWIYTVPDQPLDVQMFSTTNSHTVSWTSPALGVYTGFHVTLTSASGVNSAVHRHTQAGYPNEVVFTGLVSGTEHTATVFTVNGPQESGAVEAVGLTFPSKIPCLRTVATSNQVTVSWARPAGHLDGYTVELVSQALSAPAFSDTVQEPALTCTLTGLKDRTTHDLEAYAWVWYQGKKIYSETLVDTVKTASGSGPGPGSGPSMITSSPPCNPLTTASPTTPEEEPSTAQTTPARFCPAIDYIPPTTTLPTTMEPTTASVSTKEATTSVESTTVEVSTAQMATTVVESTAESTTIELSTAMATTVVESTAESTTVKTLDGLTTSTTAVGSTTDQMTSNPEVPGCLISTLLPNTNGLENNSIADVAREAISELVVHILDFFLSEPGENAQSASEEVQIVWNCVYDTDISTTLQESPWPDVLEKLLMGVVQNALSVVEEAEIIQVKGHPLAGGTDVDMFFGSPNNSSSACGDYDLVDRMQTSKPTVHLPSVVLQDNGTQCRSFVVVNMKELEAVTPPDQCVDNGEILCDQYRTPFPLLTVLVNPPKLPPFTEPVRLEFPGPMQITNNDRPVCVWLDAIKSNASHGLYSWSSAGCNTVTHPVTGVITCECNHLTSFSVIMKVTDNKIAEVHERALDIITMVGCIVSIVCSCLTILIYIVLRLMKEEKLIHVQLFLAIAIAQLIFVAGIERTENEVVCTVIAVAMFYFMSAIFSWMLVEVIYLYMSVVRVFSSESKMRVYFLFGWGFPVVQVAISCGIAAATTTKLTSPNYCWLSVYSGLIWAFVGPTLAIIVINTVLLTTVLREISRLIDRDITKLKASKFRTTAKALLVFTPVAGLPWMFGLLAFSSSLIIFDYIFTILNSFQGCVLFAIFVIGNKGAYFSVLIILALEVRNKIRGRKNDVHDGDTGKATTCSTQGATSGVQMTSHEPHTSTMTTSNPARTNESI